MSLLLAALLLAPPAPPAPKPPPVPGASSFVQVRQDLERATALALDDPQTAQRALLRALEQLDDFRAKLALDPDALHARDMALLALAHTYQQQSDQLRAAAAMDAFIRTVADRPFDLREFGGALVDLYAARLQLLEQGGTGSIHAACDDCMLFIDEAPVVKPRPRLYLGTYRVWLVSDSQTTASEVTISRDGEVRYVDLPGRDPGDPPPPRLIETDGLALPERVDEPERLLHVGVSVSGILISLGLVVGGSVLLASGQHCVGQADCSAGYAVPIGAALLGVGGIGGGSFTSVLLVDEVRAARRRAR
jgi:hypothetical protein